MTRTTNRTVIHVDEQITGTFVWNVVELSPDNSGSHVDAASMMGTMFVPARDRTVLMVDVRWEPWPYSVRRQLRIDVIDTVQLADMMGEERTGAVELTGDGPLVTEARNMLRQGGWLV